MNPLTDFSDSEMAELMSAQNAMSDYAISFAMTDAGKNIYRSKRPCCCFSGTCKKSFCEKEEER